MRLGRFGIAAALAFFAATGTARAGWVPLVNPPPFLPDTAVLLTDGTVMVHAIATTFYGTSQWYRLTPDLDGSYVRGTWSQLASMQAKYAPLYFASAVLADGRVLVEGGEYNQSSTAETTLGAIYDPLKNAWSPVAPPAGWTTIGDAPATVLSSGKVLLGDSQTAKQAIFDPLSLGWTTTGAGKADANSEEGFTLLPDGRVLAIDVLNPVPRVAELYDPSAGAWTSAGTTPVTLVDSGFEIGPAILRPDGTVFATGATGQTAVYHPAAGGPGTWTAGPMFPALASGAQLDIADGAAALLPNGEVLCLASPGDYKIGTQAFLFDGTSLIHVASPAGARKVSSYIVRLLPLPTGEVLFLDGTSAAQVYAGKGTYKAAWAPAITSVATQLTRGATYVLQGTQLNGLSQAVAYGDDGQMATNYPLVRITNIATGHVFYARTHDHSSMGVATGSLAVSTSFDVAAGTETGPGLLTVVASGIPSPAVHVTVQ